MKILLQPYDIEVEFIKMKIHNRKRFGSAPFAECGNHYLEITTECEC